MKPTGRKYPYKCLLPSGKSQTGREELQERSVTLGRGAAELEGEEKEEEDRDKARINRTQEIDRAKLKRSIIYRKNFKEMDNFTWGKLANH